MPYRLALDDLPRSFTKLIRREAKRLAALSPPDTVPPAASDAVMVHSRRKRLKRLRALLLLGETSDNRRSLREFDDHLRDSGRRLGLQRDADVLIATLDRLAADGLIRSTTLIAHLRAALAQAGAPTTLCEASDPIISVETFSDVPTIDFTTATTTTVIDCARRTYVRARRAHRTAERDGTSDAFHDWRKQVQRHARHLQLLADLWPADLAMRLDAAKSLSACLGDEHDLQTLTLRLNRISGSKFQQRQIGQLRTAIATRQSELRRAALAFGDRLFAERGRAFRARLDAYLPHRAHPAARLVKSDVTEP